MMPFERLESEVRSYCRSFPAVFSTARGSTIWDEHGKPYLDFFAGAGALNYGHNHPELKSALIDYLSHDGITHSLDMATVAKRRFLERFDEVVLQPRKLSYKLLFPGPTGTNAVEAALKVARKATGRTQVMCFTNGFHGMTLGSLSITGNRSKRHGAGVDLGHTQVVPFDGYHGDDVDTVGMIERLLSDSSSGIDKPAAFILEPVQAEGGIHPASAEWMQGLAALAKRHGILLIVDDIQVGCGRTGSFFSFDELGVEPDIVCLSKSLSGYGLPMSMVLLRPELDVFSPGEHNGTFRGHMPAFVTATRALEFWTDDALMKQVNEHHQLVRQRLVELLDHASGEVRGRGLIMGLALDKPGLAVQVARRAFTKGLIVETAGPADDVVKILPPLVIEQSELVRGLDILEESLREVVLEGLRPGGSTATSSEVTA